MQGLFEYDVFLIRKTRNRVMSPGNERMETKDVKLLLGICFTRVFK